MNRFNAPVGYSKNPLKVFKSLLQLEPAELTSHAESKISIETLPVDILSQILRHTDQLDVLNLAYSNKNMASVCLPRIYDTVIVDSTYTPFNKEFLSGVTYVNLLFYFKKLLKSYDGAYLIHNLYVLSFPDLFNAYDVQLSNAMMDFFLKLNHLRELVWKSNGFHLEYLTRIFKAKLRRIDLNFHSIRHPRELPKSLLVGEYPCLESLSLYPITSLRKLKELLQYFVSGSSVRLSSLSLSKFDGSTTTFAPTAEELAIGDSVSDTSHRADFETNSMQTIFEAIQPASFVGITHLFLGHILVCLKDGKLLKKSVNLTQLITLHLSNIAEYEVDDNCSNEHGFLGEIGPLLINLKNLHLDLRETQRDTVATFLASIGSLDSLDLVVRMNALKAAHVHVETMHSQHLAALEKHRLLK